MNIPCAQTGCPGHSRGAGVPGLVSASTCLDMAVADLTMSDGDPDAGWDIPPDALNGAEIDLPCGAVWDLPFATWTGRRRRTRMVTVEIPPGIYALSYVQGIVRVDARPLVAA